MGTVVKVDLQYLFVAVFADGSHIAQDLDDVSSIDPTRSQYYDVLQRIEGGVPLASFCVHNVVGEEHHVFSVSLLDGHFDVDGIPFSAQPVSSKCIPPGGEFKLLFFRDHQQDFVVKGDGTRELGEHRHAYRFGWEYSVGGQTWVQTIVVA